MIGGVECSTFAIDYAVRISYFHNTNRVEANVTSQGTVLYVTSRLCVKRHGEHKAKFHKVRGQLLVL